MLQVWAVPSLSSHLNKLYFISLTFVMQGCDSESPSWLFNQRTVSAALLTPALLSVRMDKKAKGLSCWFSVQRLVWAALWNSRVGLTPLVGPHWFRSRDASNFDQLGPKWFSWIKQSCCFDLCCVSAWRSTCGLTVPNIWC